VDEARTAKVSARFSRRHPYIQYSDSKIETVPHVRFRTDALCTGGPHTLVTAVSGNMIPPTVVFAAENFSTTIRLSSGIRRFAADIFTVFLCDGVVAASALYLTPNVDNSADASVDSIHTPYTALSAIIRAEFHVRSS
jgi:hypothetical protein